MRLRAIAGSFPDWRVGNETIAEWSGLDPDFISEKIGVRSRAFLTHEESGTALSVSACRRLFDENPLLDPGSVGLLILVTQNPDYRLPHGAALIQAALGLPNSVATFDIALGCSGYVYALAVAAGMMKAQGVSNGLIVTCDPYSKAMRRDSRDVIGLFGDAATASWMSADLGAEIGLGDFGTDGAGAQHLIVEGGGAVHPLAHLDGEPRGVLGDDRDFLKMSGRAIFNFMMTRVPASVDACLDHNDLAIEDIDFFAFHQASRFLLETLVRGMKLDSDKVPIILSDTGNTVSSSVPLVLEKLMKDGDGLGGKKVLVSGFGVGLSWATNVLHF